LLERRGIRMKEVRWGIIGCGEVTEVKSGPGFQKAEGSRLVAVMRRNGKLAEDYAKRHGVPKWYDDADALIHDPEVDAVYIATPPVHHKEYTIAAAKAGKPIYVEKPMAINYEECQEMLEACNTYSVPLFVAYYRRSIPRFVEAKQWIDSGAIGEVRYVSVQLNRTLPPSDKELPWRLQADVAGGGLFFDLASHTLDWLDYALGPIMEVDGNKGNQAQAYEVEDIVSGSFVFESGVRGMGTWCFSSYRNDDSIEIVGTKGHIEMSTFGQAPFRLVTAEGIQTSGLGYPEHVQQPLIQTIVDELRGLGVSPSYGITGARTNRVMDRLTSSFIR
jgi:1,5-anhydro-D-fructose reductase (1,5-anhydro-D-mannitol-forming)